MSEVKMAEKVEHLGKELYRTVEEHPEPIDTEIEGEIPDWIEGTLVRVGPGKFEWGDSHYNHWFDGEAILNRFQIKDGKVQFSSRFLRTESYVESEKRGKIAMTSFGTTAPPDPCKNIFARFFSYFSMPEVTDNCNVNIVKLKGDHYASTEATRMWKIDKDDLSSLERVDLDLKIKGPRSWLAHPHYDDVGTYFNISTAFVKRQNEIYKIPPKTDDKEAACAGLEMISSFPCTNGPAYFHSFAMSENYFIFMETSVFLSNPLKFLLLKIMNWTFVEMFFFDPKIKSRFHVIERKSGKVAGVFNVDAFMCFHQINAYEAEDEIVFDMCGYEDAAVMKALYLKDLRGEGNLKSITPAALRRYHLPIDKLNVQSPVNMDLKKNADGLDYDVITEGFELPRINYDFYNGKDYSYVYGINSSETEVSLSLLKKVNVKTKEVLEWEMENCYPSEPVFVPSPNAESEDDGVILSAVVGVRGQRSFFLVLDAKTMKEMARAYVPVKLTLLIHGEFL